MSILNQYWIYILNPSEIHHIATTAPAITGYLRLRGSELSSQGTDLTKATKLDHGNSLLAG